MDSLTISSFATAEALAAQVSQENYDKGLIYPPFTNIRKISAHIAASVAAKVYELGKFREMCYVLTTLHYFFCSLTLSSMFGGQVWLLIYLDLRILSNMQKVACTAQAIEATFEFFFSSIMWCNHFTAMFRCELLLRN